jgi:amino-acid N-acetyltransferase
MKIREMIEKAKLSQGKEIHQLINYYSRHADTGVLPRSLKNIYENIRDFIVYTEGKKVLGCVCLHIFWDDLGEIRSLAVVPERKEQGIGKKLVKACEKEAKAIGLPTLFTLTKVPKFFKKLGYKVIEHSKLPKVWSECIKCPKYPDCDEIALIKNLKKDKK